MATIQLGNTKVANRLISYAEERAEVREGVNCSPEYAKAQFKAIRELWGKNDGIQAHHVIQSFKPGEVTPEQANEIGQELAKEIAKGHEAVVYTHTDKDHIHNHIVINSVNFENGKKYQSTKKDLYNIREVSDRLCLERDLSVVDKSAEVRFTLAEKEIFDRFNKDDGNEPSWKDQIRQAVDFEKTQTKTFEEFKKNLKEIYRIEVLERGKNITFVHPDNGRKVRGSKLGNLYEKETLLDGFRRYITGKEQSRGSEREQSRTAHEIESSRGVSVNTSEGERSKGNGDNVRTGTNQQSKFESSQANDFNLDEFHRKHEERKRGLKAGYRQQHQHYQSTNKETGERIRHEQENGRGQADRNREEQQKQLERTLSKDNEHDLEL